MLFAVVKGCSLGRCRDNARSDTGRREEAKYLAKKLEGFSLFMIVFRTSCSIMLGGLAGPEVCDWKLHEVAL